MGAFEYTALDSRGREKTGVLEGDAARQIRQQLREQGLTPISVEQVQQKEQRTQRSSFMRRKISGTELALLTRQWATLVRSGLPVEETLRTVAQQSEKARLKSLIVAVRSKVMEGHTLAVALSDFPHVFSELYRATIEAGEQSGHLDVVLERLADYTESHQQVAQKVIQALIYPVLLTVVAIAVVIGLLTYVVPKIIKVFADTGQKLPALTEGMITVSEFLSSYGFYILIVLGLLLGLYTYLLRIEKFRYWVHLQVLRIPLVGKMVKGNNAARFARTLSIVTASGVPILDGLRIASQVIVNLPMREAVMEAAAKIREGASISRSLDASKFFPPITIHLIASGEASGNIEEMLERAASSQEKELESVVGSLLSIFEPLLILMMGGVVLTIVLAILLPIFDMNQLVK